MTVAVCPPRGWLWTQRTSVEGHASRRRHAVLVEVAADHRMTLDAVEYLELLVREDRADELLPRNPAEDRALHAAAADIRWHRRAGGLLDPESRSAA